MEKRKEVKKEEVKKEKVKKEVEEEINYFIKLLNNFIKFNY